MNTIALGLVCGLLAAGTAAAHEESAAGVRGAFLARTASVRGTALGEAAVAAVGDSSAGWTNPGALGAVKAVNAQAAYDAIGEGVSVSHVSGALPLGPGTAGLGVALVNYGSYEVYDDAGVKTGDESLSDVAGVMGYAIANPRFLGGRGTTGLAVEFVSEAVGGSLVGVSLGGLLPFGENLQVGWAVAHLGAETAGGKLPAVAKAGVSYRRNVKLSMAFEGGMPLVDGLAYGAVGVEYAPHPMAAFRFGYKARGDQGHEGMSGLTAGIGARFRGFGLDYAYQPFGKLATSHRVALVWEGRKPGPEPAAVAVPEPVAAPEPVTAPAEPPPAEPAPTN